MRQGHVETEKSVKRRQALGAVATFFFLIVMLSVTYIVITKTAA